MAQPGSSISSLSSRPSNELQNDASRSTVAAYSPRAARWPLVSMPVPWEAVASALETGDVRSLVFTIDEAAAVVDERGDLFAPALGPGGRLP